MYMDSRQSGYMRQFHKVTMLSPVHTVHNKPQCLEFFYWLFGSVYRQGNLTVGYATEFHSHPLWTQKTSWPRERVWHKLQVDVPTNKLPYRIFFQANVNQPYGSDMAVDDVKIFDGPCWDPTPASGIIMLFIQLNAKDHC